MMMRAYRDGSTGTRGHGDATAVTGMSIYLLFRFALIPIIALVFTPWLLLWFVSLLGGLQEACFPGLGFVFFACSCSNSQVAGQGLVDR